MPSLTRLPTGGVLNPLKNTTNTSHNELLHQDPLQPPLEPREGPSSPWPKFEPPVIGILPEKGAGIPNPSSGGAKPLGAERKCSP